MKYKINSDEISSQEIQDESRKLLEALQNDKELRKVASDAGICLEDFDKAIAEHPVTSLFGFGPKDMGAGPEAIEYLPIVLPVAAKIIGDCWEHLILPRLKKRWGVDFIEEVGDEEVE